MKRFCMSKMNRIERPKREGRGTFCRTNGESAFTPLQFEPRKGIRLPRRLPFRRPCATRRAEMASSEKMKWSDLLEPLKSATAHWDVDVASILAEYIEEVKAITEEGEAQAGEPALNFAEAALLISGTTVVYGKKVKDLWELTYRVLEILTQRHEQRSAKGEAGEDGAEALLVAEDEPFLLLDDVIEEGTDIDLPEGKAAEMGDTTQGSQLLLNALLRGDAGAGGSGLALTSGSLSGQGALVLGGMDAEAREEASSGAAHAALPSAAEVASSAMAEEGILFDEDEHMMQVEEDAEGGGAPGGGYAHDGGFQLDDEAEPAEAEEEEDFWAPLDPHDATSNPAPKPFKQGKTLRIPSDGAISSVEPAVREWLERSLGLEEVSLSAQGLRQQLLELSAVPSAMQPLAEAKRRERRRLLQKEQRSERYQRDLSSKVPNLEDDYREEEAMGAWDDAAPLVDDAEDAAFSGAMAEVGGAPALEDDLTSAIVQAPQTFEQLVQTHLSNFVASAAQFASETQLSSRVDAWHGHLSGQLQTENERPIFDIKAYGNACENRLGAAGAETFADVVTGAPQYECARMFLATLQLANEGRVAIGEDLHMPLRLPHKLIGPAPASPVSPGIEA